MTGAVLGTLVAAGAQYIPTLTVVDVPTDVSGYGSSGAVANITTGLVVATPSGGVAPYTYAWTQVSTSPYTWVIGSPAAATTAFTCNTLGAGVSTDAIFRCTVTDSLGATAFDDVEAFANNGQPYDSRRSFGGAIP